MIQKWIIGSTAATIAASVEQALHAGRVSPGDGLPTVRALARRLDVSPATVAAAYTLLRTRGLLAGQGRQGTRIASRRPTPVVQHAPAVPAGTVDLATGNPDPALLPSLDTALRAIRPEARVYGDEPQLRALVAFAMREFDSDGVPSRAVTVVSGALDAVERVFREHLRPGDRVGLEDPSFPGLIDLVTASGLIPVPFGLDDEGPVPQELEGALRRQCRAVVVTPRAQNPSGAAISGRRAIDLRRVLRGFPDVVLIENDYAAPITGAPAVTLVDASRRWAVIRSTSKFLGPDLRVALMAGDDLTSARVQGRQALGMRWVSHLLQELTLALWSDPSSGRRLARAAEIYTQRRSGLLTALAARGIDSHGRSGLNVWVPVRDEAHVVRAAADRGWAVAAGARFPLSGGAGHPCDRLDP